jgi:RecG-like helicase
MDKFLDCFLPGSSIFHSTLNTQHSTLTTQHSTLNTDVKPTNLQTQPSAQFLLKLPFKLTKAQQVIEDITSDFKKSFPMQRLVEWQAYR